MKTIPHQSLEIFRGITKTAHASLKILFFLLFFIACDISAQDKVPIGQTIMSVGNVKAARPDKSERALKRGDSFFTMDNILVDVASKIQLRFIDGALINLIASTEYQVDSYVFNNPNQKSESLSTLVKGGFRAISGAIAKENITGTIVKTPIATIGLRGTIYEALLENDKLFVGCEEGKVVVSNAQGSLEIGPSSPTRYAIVEAGKAPQSSKDRPAELTAKSFNVEGGLPIGSQPLGTPAAKPISATGRPAPAVKPTSATGRPAPAVIPTSATGMPAYAGQVPAYDREMPASAGELPAYAGQVPAYGREMPASAGELPASAAEMQAPAAAAFPSAPFTQEEREGVEQTTDFSNLNLEDISYDEMEGCGYDGSRRASYLAPIAVGTLSVVGIIVIVSQCTRHHHSSSSSYDTYSSSQSGSYSCHCE